MNRRELLGLAGLAATAGVIAPPSVLAQASQQQGLRLFDVRSHGASGDGRKLDSPAINRAIDACHDAGGGVVYLPPGLYLSGTVVLKSNVTLYLEAGATLLGSKSIKDYSPQSGPHAAGDANQKHLIFAGDAANIGLAGPGKIDGQGPAFWEPSGRTVPPPEEAWRDVATYDWKPLSRPSPMLEFYNCKHVRIEDVRIENAPGWTLRPLQCDTVFIRGITIKNPVIGPNTDGLDITCSRNVFVSDCMIDTGDDAICLKSEHPYGGELQPCKNITITNCVLTCCCNGLKFGTNTGGAFENIVFSNSVIFNEDVSPAARVIAGIALEMVDGGSVEGVMVSNIRMQRTRTPVFIRLGNRHPGRSGGPGTMRGIMIDNVDATGALLTSSVSGLGGHPVEDVTLSNIRIQTDEPGKAEWVGRAIPEAEHGYPEARMFGRLPAHGMYCRHAAGLRLRNIEFTATTSEERPALVCDDVADLEVDNVRTTPISGGQPVIKFIQTRQARVRDCAAPSATKTFLQIEGDRSAGIVVMNNDLTQAAKAVAIGEGVPKTALTQSGNAGPA